MMRIEDRRLLGCSTIHLIGRAKRLQLNTEQGSAMQGCFELLFARRLGVDVGVYIQFPDQV